MVMPDEISQFDYDHKSKEQLIALVKQRDDEINGWRELWRGEQQRRIALEESRGNR
jgi:hypothetical protein